MPHQSEQVQMGQVTSHRCPLLMWGDPVQKHLIIVASKYKLFDVQCTVVYYLEII